MIIIAEKINGFIPKTKKAIEEHDEEYIRFLASEQTKWGATYLDICAGTDPDIEMETMEWLIDLAQQESDLPLAVDSSDPDIILKCLPLCNKVGVINSVSMEEGKMETILPAVADTDWKIVALTCDNEGIPDDPPTKLKITDEMVKQFDEYGIDHDRIFIDPLVTTLGTKSDSFLNFAEGIRIIHEKYPRLHFTSGLSNISFGMPYREAINTHFMALCMMVGMDSAIVDPLNEHMQATIAATEALLGKDDFCMNFLMKYRQGLFPRKPE